MLQPPIAGFYFTRYYCYLKQCKMSFLGMRNYQVPNVSAPCYPYSFEIYFLPYYNQD
jgi:hypothetical protein